MKTFIQLLFALVLWAMFCPNLWAQKQRGLLYTRLVYTPQVSFNTVIDEGTAIESRPQIEPLNGSIRLGISLAKVMAGRLNYALALEAGYGYGVGKHQLQVGAQAMAAGKIASNYRQMGVPVGIFSSISSQHESAVPWQFTQYIGVNYQWYQAHLAIDTDLAVNQQDSLQVFYTDFTTSKQRLGFEAGIGVQFNLFRDNRRRYYSPLSGIFLGFMLHYHSLFKAWRQTEVYYKTPNDTFRQGLVSSKRQSLGLSVYLMVPLVQSN
jgi:hypothetical protein